MNGQGRLVVNRLWNGKAAGAEEWAKLDVRRTAAGLIVAIDARFYGDPAPTLPAGSCDGLWNFEVVELFLANAAGRYLELEFGPHGHYLTLRFAGVRVRLGGELPLSYQARLDGNVWHGRALVPAALLPTDMDRANAYAIHGQGAGRRYLAAFAVPGPRPDFHQPSYFRPCVW